MIPRQDTIDNNNTNGSNNNISNNNHFLFSNFIANKLRNTSIGKRQNPSWSGNAIHVPPFHAHPFCQDAFKISGSLAWRVAFVCPLILLFCTKTLGEIRIHMYICVVNKKVY